MRRALLPLLLLTACDAGGSAPREETPANDRVSTSLAVDSAARAASDVSDTTFVPATLMGTAFLLAPLGPEMPGGDAQLTAKGEQTAAAVSITGGRAGATYEGVVRQGSCARMGSVVAALVPVSADTLGAGRSQSDLPLPIDSLVGTPHVVAYGRGGRPESCGAIPTRPGEPPA